MKLKSLEAFCAAIEEGSITGAARRMYLSQPSVSDRLVELEREARVPLLKRSRRGVLPTQEGEMLYECVRSLLKELESVEQTLSQLRGQRESRLYVAASSTLGEHLLPGWLRDFQREAPEAIPELFVGNTQEVVALVGRGTVAFGVIEGREPQGQLESEPLLEDELIVAVAPDHPWTRGRISFADLSMEHFISRERGSGTRDIVEQALAAAGAPELDIRMELGSTSAIKEAIEAGLGFSILSRTTVRLELMAGTLAVAEGVTIPRHFTLIRNPITESSPLERRFYDHLLHLGTLH